MEEVTDKPLKEHRPDKKPSHVIQGGMLPTIAEMERSRAAQIIERWWIRVRNRKVFQVLKRAVCTAEHSVTNEVLRKLCPLEAELLRDPTIKAKVRFRFTGGEFPPKIVFKVFISNGGVGVKYFSGKKVITPATEAAEDARKMMGDQKFYDQMLNDACQYAKQKITRDVDVTTLKDYMQYSSNIDECPAYLGGRDNSWRSIQLTSLPRVNNFYNIMDFLLSCPLVKEGSSLDKIRAFSRPPTEQEKIEYIKSVSSLKSPPKHSASRESSRRSRKAHMRVEKMRKIYERHRIQQQQQHEGEDNVTTPANLTSEDNDDNDDDDDDDDNVEEEEEEEDWEKEADELYQWSQQLSIDDNIPITPG